MVFRGFAGGAIALLSTLSPPSTSNPLPIHNSKFSLLHSTNLPLLFPLCDLQEVILEVIAGHQSSNLFFYITIYYSFE
jgi:hypothetical protein